MHERYKKYSTLKLPEFLKHQTAEAGHDKQHECEREQNNDVMLKLLTCQLRVIRRRHFANVLYKYSHTLVHLFIHVFQ